MRGEQVNTVGADTRAPQGDGAAFVRGARLLAAATLALIGYGCGSPPDTASAPAPMRAKTAKAPNPFNRQYYQTMRTMPAKEMQKKIKVGMSSKEVGDLLGLEWRHTGNMAEGSMSYQRRDGILHVDFKQDRVTGFKVVDKE